MMLPNIAEAPARSRRWVLVEVESELVGLPYLVRLASQYAQEGYWVTFMTTPSGGLGLYRYMGASR